MRIALTPKQAGAGLYGLFLMLSIAGYGVTSGFPSPLLPGYPGSAMFPRLVLIAMGVICIWGIVGVILSPRGTIGGKAVTIPLGGFAGIMAMLAAFAVVLTLAGMEVAVFAMIAIAIWLRTRSIAIAAVSGLGATATVYLVFVQLLSVPLPLLFLPRYLLRL